MKYDVYQGLFIWPLKKPLNLHLTYFNRNAIFCFILKQTKSLPIPDFGNKRLFP